MGDPWSGGPPQEQERQEPEALRPEVRFVEGTDRYELGVEVDGAWIVFTTADGANVRGVQANAKANADAQAGDGARAGSRA